MSSPHTVSSCSSRPHVELRGHLFSHLVPAPPSRWSMVAQLLCAHHKHIARLYSPLVPALCHPSSSSSSSSLSVSQQLQQHLKLLHADETTKRRFRLGGKTAADFRVTAETQCQGSSTPGGLSSTSRPGDGGLSSKGSGRSDPCGIGTIQKLLDTLAVMGAAEAERDELLRGLSAVLHLGEVRRGGGFLCARVTSTLRQQILKSIRTLFRT